MFPHISYSTLDYKISKDETDIRSKQQKEFGVKAINKLLPSGSSFDSIDSNGRIWFNTQNEKVSTVALSDGFRSILALAGDLIWRIIESFPESPDPLQEHGVVLIDELDIHLHPSWQRTISGLLRETFSNIQFIMATHSPIVAAGAGIDAVTYRFYHKGNKTEVEQIRNIQSMSVDKILQSEAFGLVSPYSVQTQIMIDKYYTLKKKPHLNPEETTELQLTLPFVTEALGEIPNNDSINYKIQQFLKNKLDDKNSKKA